MSSVTTGRKAWESYYHFFPFYMLTGRESLLLHLFVISFFSFIGWGVYSWPGDSENPVGFASNGGDDGIVDGVGEKRLTKEGPRLKRTQGVLRRGNGDLRGLGGEESSGSTGNGLPASDASESGSLRNHNSEDTNGENDVEKSPPLFCESTSPKASKSLSLSGQHRRLNAPKTGTVLKRLKLDINRTASQATQPSSSTKLSCQWRKRSNKKNKSWEGDGFLYVSDSGVVLKADTKGNGTLRVLGRSSNSNTSGLLVLGQFEAEVDEEGETRHISVNQPEPQAVPAPTSFKSPFHAREPKSIAPEAFCLHDKVTVDPTLTRFLRPHQREGVQFIYDGLLGRRVEGQRGVLLADEMGLGKTLMTITVLWTLLKQSSMGKSQDASKVLVCCPVSLIDNWRKEFTKWLDKNRIGVLALNGKNQSPAKDKQDINGFAKTNVYQVLIMGYEKSLSCAKELGAVDFDVIVCDEGHRLKNNSSKVMKLLDGLGVEMRLVLTGTPIQNDLNEFYTIANFINPGILGSSADFQKRFARPILRARDVNCSSRNIIKEGRKVSNELIEITKSFTLRRTQNVISSFLTRKTDVLLFCPPTKLQKSLFKLVLGSSNFNKIINSDPRDVLALIMVYRKICNSPSLLAKDSFFSTLLGTEARKQLDPASLTTRTTGSKINVLVPLLLEFKKLDEKTVLVSNFTQTLDFLATVLSKLNIQFVRLDGSSASNTRDKLVSDFHKAEGFTVFLLSAKAGGVGLNLVGASRLVLFDNDWNPSVDLQAMARIHRDGQKKPVYIYRLFTTGCIDEKIFQRQLMKGTLSDMFLDDKSESSSNIFDFEDLKDLFNVADTNCNTHDLIECPCSGEGESLESSQKQDTQDDTDEDDELPSSGWMSASDLHKMAPDNNAKKQSIRLALSHYKHFDPTECDSGVDVSDEVVNKLLQKLKEERLLTYVLTHVTQGYS
ncbi:hypothetical protein CA3LBN_003224 [Candidozyma haemuli]|uniref:Uncharacterized protein n=1 Tax=Candidozyma haemuli TaxID=45357 RepID=A0ABX8IDT9_9ASCO|nr:hypothetical protein CA3LBN_003224 [[Candida] haemuloni]